MLRLVFLALFFVTAPALGADLPFQSLTTFPVAGPGAAAGALVWVPGVPGPNDSGPPPPPDIVTRLAKPGLDVFQFARPRGHDPLDGGAVTLAAGLTELRARGYRRIVVAGHSRGGWIALTAMAHPGLADAIVAISVAAHGTRPERQPQARADWEALWAAADAPATRVVLVQLRDDPYDPDPAWRRDVALKARVTLKSVFLPDAPSGHVGAYMPEFDQLLGAEIASFVR